MFRYRNKLGEDLALEGLQNYLNRSGSNLHELSKYMKICRVKTVMEPYVKAMIAIKWFESSRFIKNDYIS